MEIKGEPHSSLTCSYSHGVFIVTVFVTPVKASLCLDDVVKTLHCMHM